MNQTVLRAGALASTGTLVAMGAGALGAALLASPAGASTFSVSNTNDSGAGSLRQAIDDANASAGVDTISVNATGTITLASDFPTITEGVTIAGPGSASLTISGAGTYHAFNVDTTGTGAVTISGLTVTDSVEVIDPSGDGQGGAIRAINTTLTLDDVVLRDSIAEVSAFDAFGGGLFVDNAPGLGDVTISNSVIAGNAAAKSTPNVAASGGGAWIEADNVTIEGTEISENVSSFGGGAYVLGRDSFTIDDAHVTNNFAEDFTGGLLAGGLTVAMTNSVVTGNVSAGAIGGIYLGAADYLGSAEIPTLNMSNTRISDNTAGAVGGGLVFNLNSPAQLDRITVTGNVGGEIGGLDVLGSMNMTSSTVSGNVGAGINLGYGLAPTSVAVCSVPSQLSSQLSLQTTGFGPLAQSLQPSTPGPREPDDLTISNSTVTNNSLEGISLNRRGFGVGSSAVSPSACVDLSPSVNLGLVHVLAADNGLEDVAMPALSLFSLIERPNASVVAGYGTITGIDPQLQPLQQVNATTAVVPILPGSPAWDGGYPDFTPPPNTDQRGLPRVVQIVDIGAYEVQEHYVRPRFAG